jgi:hypothetical protein
MARSIAKACLGFTGLFEAELLVELLLRYWEHPRADDPDFRADLLEAAAEALRASVAGERLLQDVDPPHMNLVAAVWYVESVALEERGEISARELRLRRKWLQKVLHSLPSCFCNPDSLE